MTTAAFKGGWTFKRGDAATGSTTWTSVGEVVSLSGLGAQADDIDVTSVDSGNYREYIPGLLDGVEITVESNLAIANAMQQAMTSDANDGDNWEFQVELTDGTNTMTLTFEGAIKGWNLNPAIEEQNKIQWSVKMSGAPTIAYT